MYLKTRILLISIIILVSGCDDNGNSSPENPPATCLGFYPPTLNIKVIDSITDTDIEDANVTLYITTANNTQSTIVSWNVDRNGYYIDTDILDSGTYTIVTSHDFYHTDIEKNIEFMVIASCADTNDWEVMVYLCPLGSACV
ncbi:hypothetical protein [Kaarinaea lacus]